MKGRKPKPTALRIAEGNRGKRPLPVNEPAAVEGELSCPPDMPQVAAEHWRWIVDQVRALGIFSTSDAGMYEACARQYAQWRMLQREAESAVFVTGVEGNQLPNPAVRMARDALALLRACYAEMGLSATSRARVAKSGGGPKGEDSIADFAARKPKLKVVGSIDG